MGFGNNSQREACISCEGRVIGTLSVLASKAMGVLFYSVVVISIVKLLFNSVCVSAFFVPSGVWLSLLARDRGGDDARDVAVASRPPAPPCAA